MINPRPGSMRPEYGGDCFPGHCVGSASSEAWIYYVADTEFSPSARLDLAQRYCADGENGTWIDG